MRTFLSRLGLAPFLAALTAACGGQSSSPAADAGIASDAPGANDGGQEGGPLDGGAPVDTGGNPCDAPPTVLYSCMPVAADAAVASGCVGGPMQAGMPDPGEVFPPGCSATLPTCAPTFPNEVTVCTCGQFPTPDGGTLQWTCPL